MENNKVKKVAILIGVLLLPLIYSITYLKGFWDPYNNLDKIKVAVVNEDKCEKDCRSTELIKKLENSDSFGFVEKTKDEAEKGLLDKTYYATITIPNDFTSSFEHAEESTREASTITYRTNKKTNYIAAQLIENAVIRVEKELDKEVSKEVVDKLADKLKDVPNQTTKFSDALKTIYTGSNALNTGASKISNGTNILSTNYTTFNKGISDLNNGIKLANQGITTLNNNSNKIKEGINTVDESMATLNDGTTSLKNNYNAFNNGLLNLKNGTNKLKENTDKISSLKEAITILNSGSNTLYSGLTSYQTSANKAYDDAKTVYTGLVNFLDNYFVENPSAQSDSNIMGMYMLAKGYTESGGLDQLKGSVAALVTGASNLNNGIAELNSNKTALEELINAINSLDEGTSTLSSNSNLIKQGIDKINNGTSELKNGVQSLNDNYSIFNEGMNQLNDSSINLVKGSDKLNESSSLINNGVNELDTATAALEKGTTQLDEGVLGAIASVESANEETLNKLKNLDGLDEYTKEPVVFKDNSYGKVDDYGTFFSPFFMSLSLWLGGILIIVGLYYDPEKRFKILGKNSSNRPKRLIYYGLIGIVQSIILPIVLVLSLGFNVTSWPLFFGSCILIGLSFLSIMLFLVFNFDDVGKFIAIVLLVVQLAACAGTFPLETEPTIFQAISPFMPMTYSVELLRESFVSIDHSLLIKDIIILSSILIIFSALIFITGYFKTKKEKIQL